MFVCLALSVYHKVKSPLSDYVYVCVVLNMSTDVLLKFVSGVKLCPLSIWRCKSKWKQRTRIEHKTSPAVTAGDAERDKESRREREREKDSVEQSTHSHYALHRYQNTAVRATTTQLREFAYVCVCVFVTILVPFAYALSASIPIHKVDKCVCVPRFSCTHTSKSNKIVHLCPFYRLNLYLNYLVYICVSMQSQTNISCSSL